MAEIGVCPRCGATLAGRELQGLCPKCVAALALCPEAESKPVAILPGFKTQNFAGYQLLEEIARGGMGVVFKARQPGLNRIVAVKTLLGGQLASHDERQRF